MFVRTNERTFECGLSNSNYTKAQYVEKSTIIPLLASEESISSKTRNVYFSSKIWFNHMIFTLIQADVYVSKVLYTLYVCHVNSKDS